MKLFLRVKTPPQLARTSHKKLESYIELLRDDRNDKDDRDDREDKDDRDDNNDRDERDERDGDARDDHYDNYDRCYKSINYYKVLNISKY